MSQHLPRASRLVGIGVTIPATVLATDVAKSEPSNTTSSGGNTTIVGTSTTFVIPTPALIGGFVLVGGLALFPIVSILLNSKKVTGITKTSTWAKLTARFQKPQVLESDVFLHQRSFEKLAQIVNQAENFRADKFGNTEFMTFFKIKSYIYRSMSTQI